MVAEAVTSRVSVLPTVGSKFQTGLSAAVGGEDRWCSSSGNVLDKAGHVVGRLDARMVLVGNNFCCSVKFILLCLLDCDRRSP